MKIESLQNKKVKEWCSLKEKKHRDEKNLFLIEGDHLVKEAIKANCVKEIIGADINLKEKNIPFYEVTDSILKKIATQKSGTNIIAVCEKLKPKEITGNVCLLDNIQDPGNLGTIIRSAVAFHIDTLIVSPDTVDIYNEKTIRSSEGMLFNINIIKKDLKDTIKELKNKNYTIYGTNVKTGVKLNTIAQPQKYAIIMGNEGAGVKKELQNLCDENIYIPIKNTCESLNVGVATSIILYEFSKENNNG